jgi:5-(carboxyamino)imidazole ribonucleotide synthase
LPGILKTTTLGYDGKGQYPINTIEEFDSLNIDYSKGYILEKLVKLKKRFQLLSLDLMIKNMKFMNQ